MERTVLQSFETSMCVVDLQILGHLNLKSNVKFMQIHDAW